MVTPLVLLTGPTASGKGGAARELAPRLNAEIVSVDSMKVYRGMDIGTGKPSREVRAEDAYHLIDVVEPTEPYSVARYVREAHEAMRSIESRGRRPLLVGGTPLYIRGLLSGLFEAPTPAPALRQELRERLAAEGSAALHAELRRVDPVSAARLHPNDGKRIVRALEVYRSLGRPISELQEQFARGYRTACRILALRRGPDDLRRRIEARTDEMFARGWVEEVKHLQAQGGLGRTAAQAAGYKEIIEHLAGAYTLAETRERVKRSTWRIARKQMTWLRHLPGVEWLDAEPEESPQNLGKRLYKAVMTCHN